MADLWSRLRTKTKLISKDSIWAIIFCVIIIALLIFTTDSSPLWIYQGF